MEFALKLPVRYWLAWARFNLTGANGPSLATVGIEFALIWGGVAAVVVGVPFVLGLLRQRTLAAIIPVLLVVIAVVGYLQHGRSEEEGGLWLAFLLPAALLALVGWWLGAAFARRKRTQPDR